MVVLDLYGFQVAGSGYRLRTFLEKVLIETMAGSAPLAECPVLAAWSKSETVLKRLLEKDLLILSGARLTRQTIIMNRELLVPLINLVGPQLEFILIQPVKV